MVVITARKRSLEQGNVFTRVCHSVHGVSVQGGLCPGGSRSRGLCTGGWVSVQGGLSSRGSLSRGEGFCQEYPPCMVKSGRYASYWNAFLFCEMFCPVTRNFIYDSCMFCHYWLVEATKPGLSPRNN